MSDPASIRYKNPGAMWPGPRATKWGSTEWVQLHDGQGNKIAVFPTFVQGAAADFDLWASNYVGMTLADAIRKWSGQNSSSAYASYLQNNAGVGLSARITRDLLAGSTGWKLLKAQSHWEAGKAIPMTDAEWQQAQAMVFKNLASPAMPAPYLRKGDHGANVVAMQAALNTHGASVDVDGNFGAKTQTALIAFQESAALRPDGVCGPLTWQKLGVESWTA